MQSKPGAVLPIYSRWSEITDFELIFALSASAVTPSERSSITGSAVALQCGKAHSKINRKMGNLTPCKIVTPKNFNLKLCIRDYVGESTHHANFGSNRSLGASPHIGEILPPCDFFLTVLSCPVLSCPFFRERAQVEPLNRFSRFMAQTTCFRARKCLLGSG